MLSNFKRITVLLLTLVVAACGSTPQPVVKLNTNTFSKPDLKVGVIVAMPEEKATTHIFGAGCLLCYGVASAMTSSLDKHLEGTITTGELENIRSLVLASYKNRSASVEEITLPKGVSKLKKFKTKAKVGFAKRDFRYLKKSQGFDVVVVLELYRHGAYRSFSNYVPNGDPMGHIGGQLYAVDLTNNSYVQYLDIDEKIQPAGDWDEPPLFPSVTTSYYQAIENAKQKIKEAI